MTKCNCFSFTENCSSVTCEQGKACRLVEGLPVCVCKPRCDKTVKARGALCGTDGRKYRNYCALQRYNCATERQILVEYFGKCRSMTFLLNKDSNSLIIQHNVSVGLSRQ